MHKDAEEKKIGVSKEISELRRKQFWGYPVYQKAGNFSKTYSRVVILAPLSETNIFCVATLSIPWAQRKWDAVCMIDYFLSVALWNVRWIWSKY